MKNRVKTIVSVLTAASVMSVPVYATAVSQQDVQNLSEQAAALKKTVASLQRQVNSLEQQVDHASKSVNKNNSGKPEFSIY